MMLVVICCVVVIFVLLEFFPRRGSENRARRVQLKQQIADLRKELKEIEPQKEYARYIRTERRIKERNEELEACQSEQSPAWVVWRERWSNVAPFVVAVLLLQVGVGPPRWPHDVSLWPLSSWLGQSHLVLQCVFVWGLFRVTRRLLGGVLAK